MKHIADFIKILPLTDYLNFADSTLVSKSGADPDLIKANNFAVFDSTPESSLAGPFYTEKVRITTDKLTEEQRKKYTSMRPVIVLLFDDQGNPVLWGDLDQKVRITINPLPDSDIIDLVRKTTKPLF